MHRRIVREGSTVTFHHSNLRSAEECWDRLNASGMLPVMTRFTDGDIAIQVDLNVIQTEGGMQ